MMVAALEVGTPAPGIQETPVVVTLAAEAPVAAEEIPAARVAVRTTRRVISENASSFEAVESLTIGPFEKKVDRK